MLKRKLFTMAVAAAMTILMSMTALAGWQQDGKGWRYDLDGSGNFAKDTGAWLDGNNDGVFELYYFNKEGYMLSDMISPEGHQLNSDGAAIINGEVARLEPNQYTWTPVTEPEVATPEQKEQANLSTGDVSWFDPQTILYALNSIRTFSGLQSENVMLRVNPDKPALVNGVSNIYYGREGTFTYENSWVWFDVTKARSGNYGYYRFNKAFCFNEEGYMYINTITPDGYQVNERGELVVDGIVVMHTNECRNFSKYYNLPNAFFSSMPIGYLSYEHTRYKDEMGPEHGTTPYGTTVETIGFTNCCDDENFIW